jgi:hypothetical protein
MRHMFQTKRVFGLGPASIAGDDLLCILDGGKMPIVLRAVGERDCPQLGRQMCSEFIGDSYLESVQFWNNQQMDGYGCNKYRFLQ